MIPTPSFRSRGRYAVWLSAVLLCLTMGCQTVSTPSPAVRAVGAVATLGGDPVLVIAHRGASGHRPEHTLEAYALAIQMGADYIEPDLVMTRDGVLVARHENEIGGTTNVEARFPDRRTTKTIDGESVDGWFTEDFTLAELKSLRARERLPSRSKQFDNQFLIPTFDEVLALADSATRAGGRVIGVYPETKHPSYFASIGQPLEAPLLAALERMGWNRADAPVFIQSFEVGNLRVLHAQTPVRLIQLAATGAPADRTPSNGVPTYAELLSPAGLAAVANYAYGVGVEKRLVLPADGGETSLVRDAHAAGLRVHVWTIRKEANFVGTRFLGDVSQEIRAFIAAGVDGIFSDHPDEVVRMLRR